MNQDKARDNHGLSNHMTTIMSWPEVVLKEERIISAPNNAKQTQNHRLRHPIPSQSTTTHVQNENHNTYPHSSVPDRSYLAPP